MNKKAEGSSGDIGDSPWGNTMKNHEGRTVRELNFSGICEVLLEGTHLMER